MEDQSLQKTKNEGDVRLKIGVQAAFLATLHIIFFHDAYWAATVTKSRKITNLNKNHSFSSIKWRPHVRNVKTAK